MIFEWETPKERLKKHLSISPQQKMEWLQEMHNMVVQTSTQKDLQMRWKLRGIDLD